MPKRWEVTGKQRGKKRRRERQEKQEKQKTQERQEKQADLTEILVWLTGSWIFFVLLEGWILKTKLFTHAVKVHICWVCWFQILGPALLSNFISCPPLSGPVGYFLLSPWDRARTETPFFTAPLTSPDVRGVSQVLTLSRWHPPLLFAKQVFTWTGSKIPKREVPPKYLPTFILDIFDPPPPLRWNISHMWLLSGLWQSIWPHVNRATDGQKAKIAMWAK